MIVEVLSDHPGQQLGRLHAAHDEQVRSAEEHREVIAQRRREQRASRRWWQLRTRRRHGAELRELAQRAPTVDAGLDARRAQQAAGIEGEEAMTDALGVLSDGWLLLRGYANRRGEVDHLLVGHRGVWAVEVKARPVCVHVDGDRWSYEKFDRYGNHVEEGTLADRRGRSWGRQVSDVAGDLEGFLRSRGQDVDVRTAVVVLHDRATLGAVRDLEVDLLCAGAGCLLKRLDDEAPALDSPRCSAVARLVRRDHALRSTPSDAASGAARAAEPSPRSQ